MTPCRHDRLELVSCPVVYGGQLLLACADCNAPATEDQAFDWAVRQGQSEALKQEREETPCPRREDGQHCNCWYDGKQCCACGDPADPNEQEWGGGDGEFNEAWLRKHLREERVRA